MIGQTITMHDRSGKKQRKIVSEFYQYGKRIYNMVDPVTNEPHTALADDIDRWFKPNKPGTVLPKGSKGKNIVGKQRAWQ